MIKYKSKKNADLCDCRDKSLICNRSHQKPATLTEFIAFGCPNLIAEFMLKAHKTCDYERTVHMAQARTLNEQEIQQVLYLVTLKLYNIEITHLCFT